MEILLQIGILTAILSVVCPLAPKNSDEGRPYEFGFTIDGQQHRHEKKDERGIIQGEFGFITADGIYHVTVYATDENGNFKILSMRNIRISAPLDGSPFKGEISPEAKKYLKQENVPSSPAPQFQESNPLSLSQPDPLQEVGTKKNTNLPQLTTQPTIKAACASCGLISTPKPEPSKTPLLNNQDVSAIHNSPYALNQYENTANIPVPNNLAGAKYSGKEEQDKIVKQFAPNNGQTLENRGITAGQNVQYQSSQLSDKTSHKIHEYQPAVGPQTTNYKNFANSQNRKSGSGVNGNSNRETIAENQRSQQIPTYEEGNYKTGDEHKPEFSEDFNNNYKVSNQSRELAMGTGEDTANGDSVLSHVSNSGNGASIGDSIMITGQEPNPLQLPNDVPASAVSTLPPISVSDGVIHVGGNSKQDIHIKDKFPGMQEGLPAGIEENDITNILYKFHYTVGFHGHYERGLKDGTKIGGYFVNGRDGISRVVTYIVDENGYRPKVKFINLGLESEDTPKPETEKTFGLKSFEFVWYPLS